MEQEKEKVRGQGKERKIREKIRKIKMIRRRGGKIRIGRGITRRAMGKRRTRRQKERRTRMRRRLAAVARAPTCCLTLFTTSSGASTWPWNRHLRSVSKTNSITEKD